MCSQYPYPEYGSVRNIGVSILLSLLTLGIYGLYWQYKQMLILNPTLRTCFDTFWYFYDKPASRKDSHRIGEIWSCELRFYFPLVFFLVHLKLLTQCRDHAGLRNKYRNRKSEVRSIGLTHQGYLVLGFLSILSEKSRFGDRSYSGES